MQEITGWGLSFMIKKKLTDLDAAALLTKVPSISGVFNSNPAINTQKASVAIADDDFLDAQNETVGYWELKRTNPGAETRLAYGSMRLVRTVHRA